MEMNDFNMFVPITLVKGAEVTDKSGRKRKMVFKGVASTMKTGKDMDGEILDPNGFDYAPFLKSGHINWNHMAGKDPMAIIGEPTSAKVVDNEFHITGFLYEDSELAQKVYKAAEMLEKSGSTRKLGFSVEGKADSRDKANKKLVTKATIMNVAIAPTPKNAGAYMELVKGFEYDSESTISKDIIVDVTSGDERTLIDKSFSIAIVKATDIVLSNDDFQSCVIAIADSIKKGHTADHDDKIKSRISEFKPIMNGSAWLAPLAN